MDERPETDALHYAADADLDAGHRVYCSALKRRREEAGSGVRGVVGNFPCAAVSKFDSGLYS
jgi:hypothetical protein